MAPASLPALIDDSSTALDDVAVLTKLAAQKTAGVLGEDLALNAQQVATVRAQRERPVVWAVAKGLLVNRAILVPAAPASLPMTGRRHAAAPPVGQTLTGDIAPGRRAESAQRRCQPIPPCVELKA